MKRMISVLMVLCLLLTMVPMSVWAKPVTKPETMELPTMTEFRQPQITGLEKLEKEPTSLPPAKDPSELITANGDYVSMEEAVVQMRQQMKNRVNSITIKVKTTNDDENNVFTSIFYGAMEHTGEPGAGDNLMWQWGRLSVGDGFSSYESGGEYYYTMPYEIHYYTTAAMEAELDVAVEELLDDLDLYSASDYDKISGIYEYITENVTYDNYHLETDPDYDPMYTAYAALVDGTAVCQGYANLFYRLMLELDVDTRIVVGWGGGPHAWNIVELEDRYYYVDSTWDATYAQAGWGYEYFLKGSANFTRDHTPYVDECPFLPDYPISETDYGAPEISWPVSGTCGDNLFWSLTEEGVLTISGTGPMWDYPEEYPGWYQYVSRVKACVIEEGVTNVSEFAFYDCWSLTSISIPDSVTSIGKSAFYGCGSLADVTMNSTLTYIGLGAFYECRSLTSIHIPVTVSFIGDYAFAWCDNLSDVYYGGSPSQWTVMFIGVENEPLRNATIHYAGTDPDPEPEPEPEYPEADYLAQEWELLKLTNRERAAAGLAPLTTNELLFHAADIRALELSDFYYHDRPNGASFDSVLGDLGYEYRMAGENKGRETNTPNGVMENWLGDPESSAKIFSQSYFHVGVGYKVTDGAYSHYWDQLFTKAEFCRYTNFELNVDALEAEQGISLDDMQLWATLTCDSCGDCYLPILAEYCTDYDPDTPGTQSVTVSVLNFSETMEITVLGEEPEPEPEPEPDPGAVASGKCGNNVTWSLSPDGVLTISGTGPMWDYPQDYPGWNGYATLLRKVVFEGEVTHIGDYAFWGYSNIEEVLLPESLRTIGGVAFGSCSGLREITIPANVQVLKDYAFANCTSLEMITFQGSAPNFGGDVFLNVDAMAAYPIGDPSWNESTCQDYGGNISWINGEQPVSLELVCPPAVTGYAVGENVELSGICVAAVYGDGDRRLLKSGVLTLESADTSTVGVHTAVVSYMGLTAEFPIYIHSSRMYVDLDPALWPESPHDYGSNMDDSQYISYNGADSLILTFSEDTYVENGYDFLYVYDADDNEIARFTGFEAAGATVTVPGDTARIRLVSDYSYNGYGYALSAATANVLEHVGEAVEDREPDCINDGVTSGVICQICGRITGGQIIPALGHEWSEWQHMENSAGMYRVCSRCEEYDYLEAEIFTSAGDSEYEDLSLAEIRALYDAVDWDMQAEYAVQPSLSVPYAPGRLTDSALNNLLAQTNFIRRLAGLDSVGLSEELVEYAQAASLVNAANDDLSHYPTQPSDMAEDLYQLGYTGASRSNLAWGTHMGMMDSIPGYLDDSDSSNIDAVGHRRWLLNPNMGYTGFGVTSAGYYSHYHAMYAFDQSNAGGTDADFVAYPGGNRIYPSEFFAPHVAWSVQLNPDTFLAPNSDEIRVTLIRQSDGKQWEFSNQATDSTAGFFNVDTHGYGDGYAVIFRPAGVNEYEGVYQVLISGLRTREDELAAIEYTVDFRSLAEPEPEPEPNPDPITDCGATEEDVYEILISLQDEYPEGMPWDNSDSYQWNINNTIGYGCAAFAFILSDAAFGYLPSQTIYDDITIDDLRVGDILRVYDDTHSVVVLEVHDDHIVLAEGNYNNSIHWGRIMTAEEVAEDTDYVVTRYPEHNFVDGVCTECGAEEEIPSVEYGDATGDGTVNILDMILLRQYTAGWNVTLDMTGADANGDGTVNVLDMILLRQYVAGWDVTLGPQE